MKCWGHEGRVLNDAFEREMDEYRWDARTSRLWWFSAGSVATSAVLVVAVLVAQWVRS